MTTVWVLRKRSLVQRIELVVVYAQRLKVLVYHCFWSRGLTDHVCLCMRGRVTLIVIVLIVHLWHIGNNCLVMLLIGSSNRVPIVHSTCRLKHQARSCKVVLMALGIERPLIMLIVHLIITHIGVVDVLIHQSALKIIEIIPYFLDTLAGISLLSALSIN